MDRVTEGNVIWEVPETLPKPIRPLDLKLDLGCGKGKKDGYWGVDSIQFPGVDEVVDLRQRWPWDDNSVIEVHCSHFLEHLEAWERVHFANELWRVLKPGRYDNGKLIEGFAYIVTPYWRSSRAYGDPTHKWPPVSEFAFLYWNKQWRAGNAPHDDFEYNPNGFKCDFDAQGGGSFHPALLTLSAERQQYAIQWFCEAFQDGITTVVKRA